MTPAELDELERLLRLTGSQLADVRDEAWAALRHMAPKAIRALVARVRTMEARLEEAEVIASDNVDECLRWKHRAEAANSHCKELEAERDKWRAERDKWRLKWEDLEINRASCCSDNEQRAETAETRVMELLASLPEARAKSGGGLECGPDYEVLYMQVRKAYYDTSAKLKTAEARCKDLERTCETIRNDWRKRFEELKADRSALLDAIAAVKEDAARAAELTQLRAQVEAMRGALERAKDVLMRAEILDFDNIDVLAHEAIVEADRVLGGEAKP
ncbi:MAG TPA: hypothetical protein VFT22_11010 [Kofleriaceae bacterium]|nr:hypothetical protein [Kofleriaceae bacterium]